MIVQRSGIVAWACLVLAVFFPAATTARAQGAAPAPDTVSWLSSDSASRTVTLRLEVTRPAGSSTALINGHHGGSVQMVVPLGWTVQWEWHSADSTTGHSLVVMTEREKLPTEGGRPAFDNALTRMVTAGLPPGQTDKTTFAADQAGWYWMLCGVPNHAIAGEYIGLRVDSKAEKGEVKLRREK